MIRVFSSQGGLRPVMAREHMAEPLAEAVFALAPGAVSDPIDTQEGFEICAPEERLPARPSRTTRSGRACSRCSRNAGSREAVTRLVDELWSRPPWRS